MSDLVSVIIPVYKVEKYLEKCVDSVLSQNYKNLEIFLVDDGSPDNCGKICDEFAKKDNRIKVIHKENGGVSSARNAALDVCTGEYITFVDSDDWVEPTYVEELYNAIKKYDCDMSVCFYNNCKLNGEIKPIVNLNCKRFYAAEETVGVFFNKDYFIDSPWAKMYKREIFNKVRYPQGMHYEDAYAIVDVCSEIKKGIAVSPFVLYNYLILRDGAITTQVSKKTFDWIRARRHLVEKVDKNNSYYKYCCVKLFYTYSNVYQKIEKEEQFLEEFFKMFKEDYKMYKKFMPFKQRIRFFVFKHFRCIYKKIWMK